MKKTLKNVVYAFVKTYIEYGTLAQAEALKTYLLQAERTIKVQCAKVVNALLLQTLFFFKPPTFNKIAPMIY